MPATEAPQQQQPMDAIPFNSAVSQQPVRDTVPSICVPNGLGVASSNKPLSYSQLSLSPR